jgi:hypothetical protein
MWNYSSVPREDAEDEEDEEDDAEDRLPGGKHYLIITGYDDATDQFRVFDPWLGQGSMPDEPELHEYYISYEGYADPKVSLGLPVTAVHAEDYYNLRRFVVDAPQAILGSGDFVQDTPEPVVLEAAGFDEILHLSHEIQALAHQRIVYAHDGSPVAGTKRAGEAFPIVALTTRQVIEADGAPHRLLIQRAWALIAPVVAGGRIIDSFQMYRTEGKWKQGGYANARVAQLMIKAAEKLRGELGDQQQLYLVSIPEQVMFFAAGGEGATAKLVSLDNDAKGPILAAKDALDGVLKVIRRQRKDPMGRRPPPRPRPR